MIEIVAVGAQALIEDLGRPGYAHLGVPCSGALDRSAAAAANRLVGNDSAAAVLEVLLGGLQVRARRGVWVAVSGAPVSVRVEARARGFGQAVHVPEGAVVRLGVPEQGMRSYLAVRGGIEVPAVLGSRSSDLLGGLGPAPVAPGDLLGIGAPAGPFPASFPAAVPLGWSRASPDPDVATVLRVLPGPHADWIRFGELFESGFTVLPASDRAGLRLAGTGAVARRVGELEPLGMIRGAVQLPPNGEPVILLADHGPTGGYPVVAVVAERDLDACAQLRPGQVVQLRPG